MYIRIFLTQISKKTDNRIGVDCKNQLGKIATAIQQDRLMLRKQVQKAFILILLCHRQAVEDSEICGLPLEILHYIIRLVLIQVAPGSFTLIL